MFIEAITATVLVAQPADDVASAFEPVSVEVVGRGSAAGGSAAVWALDSTGQVIGTIATWQDKDGVHIASDYSDGWAETVVHDGEVVSHDATLPSAVLQERAETLASLVASGSGSPQPLLLECGALLLGAGGACATGNVWACAATTVLAYCACAKVEDFGLTECP